MHPADHARTSARIWGGEPDEYLAIHQFFDDTKRLLCDFRHRALRHHAQGIFEAERVLGVSFVNSVGRLVHTRYVGEQHVKEDCGGRIPDAADWLRAIVPAPWMSKGYPIHPE